MPEWLSWDRLAGIPHAQTLVGLALLLLLCLVVSVITRRLLVPGVEKLILRSKTTWDDALHEARVLDRLSHAAPVFVAYSGVNLIPDLPSILRVVVQQSALASLVLIVALTLGAFLTATNSIYASIGDHRRRPIKGYLQVVKIIMYVVALVVAVSMLLNRSPLVLLSGIGAMTAVILLIFRDTIISLVASIQLTNSDMVRIGDWIEMPKYGADGDVIDIALHTVKVQNWDKTVTTIPTYAMISDSYKNWRGMREAGGRRIKRALYLDVNSIRFLTDQEIAHFKKFDLLRDYVEDKLAELAREQTDSEQVNRRRLTNVGTFRAYVYNYLRAHPKVHQGLTLIVRQRDPGPEGLPLEIYAFTNDTAWAHYEGIQSDIFDHILAIVPEFGLRLFQKPAGADLAGLIPAAP